MSRRETVKDREPSSIFFSSSFCGTSGPGPFNQMILGSNFCIKRTRFRNGSSSLREEAALKLSQGQK